uniref:SH2 domain-containing protein n=1 Tax=Esox lucius TaxID=8010 RepID=A0AAY5KSM4_ESOLU
MSFESVPQKSEVMGWNTHSLSNYMKRLSGCDNVVKRSNMNGERFLVRVYVCMCIAAITFMKLLCAVILSDQGEVSDHPFYEDMSDNDYESPDNEEDDSYICAMSDHPSLQPPVGAAEDNYSDEDYELPPSSTEEIPRFLNPAQTLENPDYIGPVVSLSDTIQIWGWGGGGGVNTPQPGRNTSCSDTWIYCRCSGVVSSFWILSCSVSIPWSVCAYMCLLGVGGGQGTDMDPGWYGGLVTRGQAEAFLRQVNKDAAFLVRDSSKGSPDQPYTLMVLSQDKVYNIQIRRKGNTYQLGTGLMGSESFPGVKEMIEHFKHTPLLLIDAMERGTGVHQECCLLHPGLLS